MTSVVSLDRDSNIILFDNYQLVHIRKLIDDGFDFRSIPFPRGCGMLFNNDYWMLMFEDDYKLAELARKQYYNDLKICGRKMHLDTWSIFDYTMEPQKMREILHSCRKRDHLQEYPIHTKHNRFTIEELNCRLRHIDKKRRRSEM